MQAATLGGKINGISMAKNGVSSVTPICVGISLNLAGMLTATK